MIDPLVLTHGFGAAPALISDEPYTELVVPRVRSAFDNAVVEPVPVEAHIDHGVRGNDLSKVYQAVGGPNARIRALIANSGNAYQDLRYEVLKSDDTVAGQPASYQIVVELPGKKDDRRQWSNANIQVHVRDDKASNGEVMTVVHVKVDPEAHKGATGFSPLAEPRADQRALQAQPYFIAFALPSSWDAAALLAGREGEAKGGVSADVDTGVLRLTVPVKSNMLGYAADVGLGGGRPAPARA